MIPSSLKVDRVLIFIKPREEMYNDKSRRGLIAFALPNVQGEKSQSMRSATFVFHSTTHLYHRRSKNNPIDMRLVALSCNLSLIHI